LNPNPQIIVLDAGGQYCHLEARKVRDLGVYAEVRASETPAAELSGARGLIISGGPSSVYDAGSPTVDPAIFSNGQAVLGICYGQQIMAHLLGGEVRRGEKGEYGMATLQNNGPGQEPRHQATDGRPPHAQQPRLRRGAQSSPLRGLLAPRSPCRAALQRNRRMTDRAESPAPCPRGTNCSLSEVECPPTHQQELRQFPDPRTRGTVTYYGNLGSTLGTILAQ
jgi:hypothetical protein